MEFIKAKNILTRIIENEEWYGINYNMNLYKGCSHGCIYCDSRSSCYHIENFDVVRSKENVLTILEGELMRKKVKGVVGIGSMSDTYNPQEKKYKITRGALELLSKYNFGVSIDTKSDLVLRDLDLLEEINEKNNVIVKITITTPHDNLSKVIEPGVPPSSRRFEVIKELSDKGIFTGIMLNPVLPFITDNVEDIKLLVKLAYQHGAKFIHTYMGMTLRENQRDYYYKKLDENFIGFKEKYMTAYKDYYCCLIPNCKNVYKVFASECEKYGILYKMSDIIKAYQTKNQKEQISLFD